MGESRISDRVTFWDQYDSFLKGFQGLAPGLDDFDCAGDYELLAEYQNFKPSRILELLVLLASEKNISPALFHKEMRMILTHEFSNNSTSEREKIRIGELKNKYEVKKTGTDSDSITVSRLGFMFPHYSLPAKMGLSKEVDYRYYFNNGYVQFKYPKLLNFHEFGSVIPSGHILKASVWKAIITARLYFAGDNLQSSISFRTHQILLRKRIGSSLLSDERRINLLQMYGVVTTQKELTSNMADALKCIKIENNHIIEDIEWDLIG
ncbi:unnamed protein product [Bemisia tabaci]|uniref:Uncharacterized protein n=1 Tax=Bemisia tabaci TaxID=7038 RepID=A0A9P0F1D7_BEMTA|nr:PREDICTED: uncharacterized protein LOC109030463 [Bemisia tabaci]XP_018896981.1 PREDICTED: uncharacterized protein LOC109030463 [Bemisia tabaci]CAH0384261.1 unnamed protein product [Bemisia tabaci]